MHGATIRFMEKKNNEFVIQDGSTLLKIVKLFGCFIPAVNNTATGGPSDFYLAFFRFTASRVFSQVISFVPTRARPSLRQSSRTPRMSYSTVCRCDIEFHTNQTRHVDSTDRKSLMARSTVRFSLWRYSRSLHCLIIRQETIPNSQERVTAARALTSAIIQI